MPYILKADRDKYDESIAALSLNLQDAGDKCGDITYVLYRLVADVFDTNPCYQTIAEIRAALVGTLSEFDRRYAFPYEDKKIRLNGDVVLRRNK
jgi:hypothetical protein